MSGGRLLLLGGGDHAAVVAESARTSGWTVVGYLDDEPDNPDAGRIGLRWLGTIEQLDEVLRGAARAAAGHAAVGDPACRRRWLDALREASAPPIIHATASVSPSAMLGRGAFVGPAAVVNARARIGRGAIVNSGAVIEHDCVLGAFCHVAPGAALGGRAGVGRDALVGLNASVLPGVQIGEAATVGAGAVAVSDVADGATAIGVPARTLAVTPSSVQDRA